ncbi:amidohydrolase family protein [Mesobacillus foraminis]|uniref:amidohydrolase family protein n=1 Tax=Mesobacillus foraminis TaxID=279826 RepID=UPI001BE6A9EE|nr:amidohydrolase family protein [Mesobacillus foraminis]MBT2759327.1 amidohydrolase family protein [Mesobacillus foraminis]
MIIDGHAHISPEAHSNAETLIAAMNDAEVSRAVLIPGGMLDVRQMTDYVTGKKKPETVEPPNDFVLQMIKENPDYFIGFCCLNPNEKIDVITEKLEQHAKEGFKGVKMAPMVHQFSLLGKASKSIADLCGQLGMPYYTHTLFHASASTASVGTLAKEFKNTSFVIGHMGFGPLDVEAIELATTLDNVYLETSTANFLSIKMAVEKAGAEKMFYGSEFPLSDPVVERTKIERLNISDSQKEQIYSKTILELLKA